MFPTYLPPLDRPALVCQAEPAPATPWIEMLVGSMRPLPSARFYVFGATGDLVSKRAVRDAMVELAENNWLSSATNPLVLLGPTAQPAAAYLERFQRGDEESKPISQAGFEAFRKLARLDSAGAQILGVNVTKLPDYQALQADLKQESAVFYGALPPKLYGSFLDNLRQSRLAQSPPGGFRRILLEKPFGNDSTQARQLDESLEKDFEPDQVLLVDHFLAYPGMTNMLCFRSDPAVDEALQGRFVEKFEIKVLESIKSNDRPYFRDTGLIKDMVQSHGLQVFATMAMELPQHNDLRGERRKVIEEVQIEPESARRGQFVGFNDPAQGSPVGATPSQAETYVSFRFRVNSPRWRDVPFRFVNAKGLDHKRSGVDIYLRALPEKLAQRWQTPPDQPVVIHTTMNPVARIWVDLPGRTLEIPYDTRVPNRMPYSTLFLQAIRGDNAIFATPQESLAGWRVADRLTQLVQQHPMISYQAGAPLEQIDDR